jgi:hypothetical protein
MIDIESLKFQNSINKTQISTKKLKYDECDYVIYLSIGFCYLIIFFLMFSILKSFHPTILFYHSTQ